MCRDTWRGVQMQRSRVAEQAVPHTCVVVKNQEGYLRSKGSQPCTRPPSPEFQHQEDRSPKLLAVKTSGDWGSLSNCRILRSLPLKG